MISLSTIEVNRKGKVLSVATPATYLLNGMFPNEDGNITSHYDNHTNEIVKEHLEVIFNSSVSIEFPITINHHPLQCTAHHYAKDKAFLHFKHIEQSISENLQEIAEKKSLQLKLKLVDFTFRHATTAILLINDDNTIYDFNEAMPFMMGYTKEEFKSITLLNLDPYKNKEGWATLWANLKTMKALELQRKLKQKDGKLIDVEMSINLIKYGDTELNCAFITDVTESKKLLEKLKLVDFAFNNASTAILLVKEDGSIHDFNLISLAMFGYTKTEMEDLHSFDIDPNASPEVRKGIWDNLKNAGTTLLHRPFKKKDGTWMDMEVKANMVKYGNVEYNCAFITDITESKKKEEHLNVVDFTFQNASTAILLLREDGTFYDFNLATLSLFGYTREEMMELNVFDVEPEASPETRKPIWESIRASKKLVLYKKLKRKDGTWRDLEVRCNLIKKGNIELNCAFITDITEKKRIDERLKLLEKVVTETNQSVVISDATKGMSNPIIYANEAFTNITGYSVEEVKGKNPRFLHKGRDVRDDEGRTIMRNALTQFIPWKVIVINTKKNGEHYWADISGFPVFDKVLNKYTHWVAIQTDITSKKEAELEKQQMLDELIENNKELVQFSYITTHNLRAPLTNLISICKKIDTTFVEDEMTVKLIEGFKQSTSLLNDTLDDLIKILIIKENRHIVIAECVFEETLEKIKASISTILLKNVVKIEADFSEAITVSFVCIYLESIFLNLLTNAIKYSHPTRYPIVKIKTFKDASGCTKLTFSDNGRGMNMERVKNKIFGLYQRFHSNADGKGIGLYLIHSQITALGGKIEVESEEGVGTTFTITFR